jgi:LuxR family transcriptional regulator, quorum-sensing system regulator BjaR1
MPFPTDPYWAIRSLEFVTAVQAASTRDETLGLYGAALGELGFHSFLFTAIDERDFSHRVLAKEWHPEWAKVYVAERMTEVDPVRRKLYRTLNSYLWSEARYACRRSKLARVVMDRAAEFRMNQGVCIPVYDLRRPIAAFSISGEKPDLGVGVRPALDVISLFTYYRLSALKVPSAPHGDILLTRREREVLKWVMAGKSYWDISAILHIAERTARAHMSNAARKLNATTRTQAIVEAVRVGAVLL